MVKASIAFELIDALVTQSRAALPDVDVFDGYGVSGNPGDVLMIGVADPFDEGAAQSITSTQTWAYAGATTRNEEGDVNCIAYAWNGDKDQEAARNSARALCDAVATLMRDDYTLGIAELLWCEFRPTDTEQQQDDNGAYALIKFQVHYRAQI